MLLCIHIQPSRSEVGAISTPYTVEVPLLQQRIGDLHTDISMCRNEKQNEPHNGIDSHRVPLKFISIRKNIIQVNFDCRGHLQRSSTSTLIVPSHTYEPPTTISTPYFAY